MSEEMAQAYREASRAWTALRAVRYLSELDVPIASVENATMELLTTVVGTTLCDRAVLLKEKRRKPGQFERVAALGFAEGAPSASFALRDPPHSYRPRRAHKHRIPRKKARLRRRSWIT